MSVDPSFPELPGRVDGDLAQPVETIPHCDQ